MTLPAVLLACALLVAPSIAVAAGSGPFGLDQISIPLTGLLAAAYPKAPMLVLVLLSLVIVPCLALLSLTMRKAVRFKARRQAVQAQLAVSGDEWTRRGAVGPEVPAWPVRAWLASGTGAPAELPPTTQMVSIGRHQDNDIRLADSTVHRYHAVIQRTEDARFVITDLSGEDGNGVRVNGARLAQAALADGDLIELGKARLTFAAVPV